MAFNVRKLTQCDYLTSVWSGGTTTQLAIFPPEAKYADRDFLWRVSSATVDLEESDFTALPDYDRLIATLRGEIVLTHNGGAPLTLRPYEVHAFSGGDATHSVGRCTDFNLMLRRGRASGTMEALHLAGSAQTSPAKGRGSAVSGAEEGCRPLEADETLLLYCAAGSCTAGDIPLRTGETLLCTDPIPLTLTGAAELMLCRIKVTNDPL